MQIPKQLEDAWLSDNPMIAETLVAEDGSEYPEIVIDEREEFRHISYYFEGLKLPDELVKIGVENLYFLFNQGGYSYMIDTSSSDGPVYYVTFDSENDINVYPFSSSFSYLHDQLEEYVDTEAKWNNDYNLYEIQCKKLASLPSWIRRIFVKKEAKVCGLLALILEHRHEDNVIIVGDRPSYDLVEYGFKKISDKLYDSFIREMKSFSHLNIKDDYDSCGEHGEGIVLPYNLHIRSMMYIYNRKQDNGCQ